MLDHRIAAHGRAPHGAPRRPTSITPVVADGWGGGGWKLHLIYVELLRLRVQSWTPDGRAV